MTGVNPSQSSVGAASDEGVEEVSAALEAAVADAV